VNVLVPIAADDYSASKMDSSVSFDSNIPVYAVFDSLKAKFSTMDVVNSTVFDHYDRRLVDYCSALRYHNTSFVFAEESKYLTSYVAAEDVNFLKSSEGLGLMTSKTFHCITSSVAYTIMNLSQLYLRSNNYIITSVKDADKSLLGHLLHVVMRFYSGCNGVHTCGYSVKQCITDDMLYALFPDYKMQTAVRLDPMEIDVERAVASLPYHAVTTSLYPPDRILFKMLHLHHSVVGDSQATIWGFLRAPLLSMDLQVFAVICSVMGRDNQFFSQLLPYIIVAKVAQILLDPVSTGRAMRQPSSTTINAVGSASKEHNGGMQHKRLRTEIISPDMPSSSSTVTILMNLRVILAEHAAIVLQNEISSNILLEHVLDSLVTFIHYLVLVFLSMQYFQSEDEYVHLLQPRIGESTERNLAFIQVAMNMFQLPFGLESLLTQRRTEELYIQWANHLRQFYLPSDR
jgi:hypothetical protein